VGAAEDPLGGAEPAALEEPALLGHPQGDVDIGWGYDADRDLPHGADHSSCKSGGTRSDGVLVRRVQVDDEAHPQKSRP
jgi:hypothetical protein